LGLTPPLNFRQNPSSTSTSNQAEAAAALAAVVSASTAGVFAVEKTNQWEIFGEIFFQSDV